MQSALIFAVLGLCAGHLVRRVVPWTLGQIDRRLPFARPWLEIVTALLFFSGRWLEVGWTFFALVLCLTLACACDYRAKLIPDLVNFGGAAFGLLCAFFWPEALANAVLHRILLEAWSLELPMNLAGPVLSLTGAFFGFSALELLRRFFSRLTGLEVMGMGDSKLLLLIGAFLGPQGALMAAVLGFMIGVPHGLIYLKVFRQPHSPFGPPLAAGALTYALAGERLFVLFAAFQGFVLELPAPALISAYAVLLGAAVALLLRLRRRAALYSEMIEADYERIENELEKPEVRSPKD